MTGSRSGGDPRDPPDRVLIIELAENGAWERESQDPPALEGQRLVRGEVLPVPGVQLLTTSGSPGFEMPGDSGYPDRDSADRVWYDEWDPMSTPFEEMPGDSAPDSDDPDETQTELAVNAEVPPPAVNAPSSIVPLALPSSPRGSVPVPSPVLRSTHRSRDSRPEQDVHKKRLWALGGVLVVALGFAALVSVATQTGNQERRTPSSQPGERPPMERSAENTTPVGPTTCGICGGDGRIDDRDKRRRLPPFTTASVGPCPYCRSR